MTGVAAKLVCAPPEGPEGKELNSRDGPMPGLVVADVVLVPDGVVVPDVEALPGCRPSPTVDVGAAVPDCGLRPVVEVVLDGLVVPDVVLVPDAEVVPDVVLVLDVDDEDVDELLEDEVELPDDELVAVSGAALPGVATARAVPPRAASPNVKMAAVLAIRVLIM